MATKTEEYRVQRWDGQGWRQSLAMSRAAAIISIKARHEQHPDQTFRILLITTITKPGYEVGPDREVAPPSRAVVPGLAEIEAACEAEGTPLRVQTEEVNLGGRCSECGYTYGHRMDCCFI